MKTKQKVQQVLKLLGCLLMCVAILATTFNNTSVDTYAKNKENTISMKNIYYQSYKFNTAQKKFWKTVMTKYNSGIHKGKHTIIAKMTVKDIQKLCDHARSLKELTYMDVKNFGTITYVYTDTSYTYLKVKLDFKKLHKMIKSSKSNKKKIKKIIKKLKLNKKTTENDAVLKINNYLRDNIKYDYTYTKRHVSNALKGCCVCSGYGETFKLICKTIGIKCSYVTGVANNTSHCWNKVKVNGKWKYIDVTWNSCIKSNKWYLLSKSQIDKDHKQNGVYPE